MFSLIEEVENEETLKRPAAELKRKQYDAKRYKLNSELYKQRVVNYRAQLKEDIPRMKAKILEELTTGKKIWLTKENNA